MAADNGSDRLARIEAGIEALATGVYTIPVALRD